MYQSVYKLFYVLNKYKLVFIIRIPMGAVWGGGCCCQRLDENL